MENKSLIKKSLPYIVAFVIFMVVCVLYFKPQYEGMSLRQSDMVQVSGMSNDIKQQIQQTGEHPQWSGAMFGGMPSYLIDFDFKGRVVRDVADVFFFLGEPASYVFLAMSCFFIMLLCFGVNPYLSIIGAFAYGFSTYFLIIIEVGHITKMVALAYAPAMIGAVFLAYRKNLWLGALLAAIFGSLEIGANHLQITYYFAFALLALIINEAVRACKGKTIAEFLKRTGILVVAALLAVGSNLILLWYLNDYSKDTMRGGSEVAVQTDGSRNNGLDKDYATAWSYGKIETLNLFIPNMTGGGSQGGFSPDGEVAESLVNYNAKNMATSLPGYWGEQPWTSGPVYIGAVMVFLFVLGMFLLCGVAKWWIFGVTILSILLAWGHNLMWFTDLFFNYFPYYNKFRTISMILVIAEWSLPLMAVLTLQKLWNGGIVRDKFVKSLKYSLAITGGVALLLIVFGALMFDFVGGGDAQFPQEVADAMRSERASMLRSDALRSLIFVLLTAAAVWALYNAKIKRSLFVVVMILLVAIDMIGVGVRYLNYDTFMLDMKARQIVATPANIEIAKDKELGYRVANFTVSPFSDATTSYFHRSIGGYNAAKLSRYQDLIDRHLSKMNWGVYNMLNTKYVIGNNDSGEAYVQINPGAFGAAWFIDTLEYVDNAEAELSALGNTNPRTTAVVDKRFEAEVGTGDFAGDSTARIVLTNYTPSELVYQYSATNDGIAVFSEIYYKGWTAYIDGSESSHFRADYILRAMRLPAGNHTVEFKFKAPHYTLLATITYVCSFILIGGVIVIIVVGVVKKRKK